MSRLIMIFGIILILVGIGGMVVGFTGIGSTFLNTVNDAINPTAEELCNPGETLERETGPETYSPSMGYGRSVSFFCVDASGERREVTGDFVQGMLGQVFGSLPTMFFPAIGGCILTIGIFFLVIGFVLSARRRGSPRMVTQTYGFDFPQAADAPPAPRSGQRQPSSGDLTTRLRQLDEARHANLITEDEYQRKRREILDSMR